MREQLLAVGGYLWRHSPSLMRQGVMRVAQRTYTVGVVGLVPDENEAVLLVRHRFRTPYQWGLPGGYLEYGETPAEALKRELKEELGVATTPESGILEHELNHASRCISYFLLMRPEVPARARLNRAELLDWRFCTVDALPADTQPTHVGVLQRYWASPPRLTPNLVVLK